MTNQDSQFPYIPPAAVDSFRRIGDRLELSEGEQFIQMDDFDESIFLIESGRVEVERDGQVIGTIDTGDVVGEIAFIDRRPRTASVRTLTDAILLRVERADLLRDLASDPTTLMEFVRAIEARRVAHIDSGSETEIDERVVGPHGEGGARKQKGGEEGGEAKAFQGQAGAGEALGEHLPRPVE